MESSCYRTGSARTRVALHVVDDLRLPCWAKERSGEGWYHAKRARGHHWRDRHHALRHESARSAERSADREAHAQAVDIYQGARQGVARALQHPRHQRDHHLGDLQVLGANSQDWYWYGQ